jgi:hypothetical protein
VAFLVVVLGACVRGPVERPAPYMPGAHDALVGLDREALLARLGEPEMLRRERGAEYWRYRHQGCLIDIFLFADPPTAEPRIIHVGVRRPSGAPAFAAVSCETVAAEFATGDERLPASPRSY